jgi:hypothetical protein
MKTDRPDCPICLHPCDVRDGYSVCHNALITQDMPLSKYDAITTPEDLTERELGRTSDYFGVFRIVRKNGTVRWRVKFRRRKMTFQVGEYEKEITAAQVYDNAIYWACEELDDKERPNLNFPRTYATAATRPRPWLATQRVLRKIRAKLKTSLL